MALLKVLFSLLYVVLSVSAVASPACSKFPYDVLLPLSNYPPAQSFCSSKYPLRPCTSTVTTTATRTAPAVTVSSTVTTATVTTGTSTATTTVSTTTVTSITATITQTSATKTETNTVTTTTATTTVYTSTATVTITTNAAPIKKAKRTAGTPKIVYVPARVKAAHPTTLQRRAVTTTTRPTTTPPTTPSDPKELLFKKLQSEAAAFVGTLCTCIETQPPCLTSTATATASVGGGTFTFPITATSSVRATTTTSVTATTTISTNTVITTDVPATTTVSVGTTTTISTATTTTTYVIIPTPSCQPGIQRAGGTYNCEYNVVCGQAIVSASSSETPVLQSGITSQAQCLLTCSNDPVCNAFNFDSISQVCTLYETRTGVGGSFTYVANAYADYGTFTGNCG